MKDVENCWLETLDEDSVKQENVHFFAGIIGIFFVYLIDFGTEAKEMYSNAYTRKAL